MLGASQTPRQSGEGFGGRIDPLQRPDTSSPQIAVQLSSHRLATGAIKSQNRGPNDAGASYGS
jgi:hypothetical protein